MSLLSCPRGFPVNQFTSFTRPFERDGAEWRHGEHRVRLGEPAFTDDYAVRCVHDLLVFDQSGADDSDGDDKRSEYDGAEDRDEARRARADD